jgi:hypothetical protein
MRWQENGENCIMKSFSSPSIIRIMKARRMRFAGEKRNAYTLLVGKSEGRRPLGRPRRWWMDNIRMDLVEVGWGDVDWIGLAQDRDRSCEFGIEPSGSINCWETIDVQTLGISRVVLSSMELVMYIIIPMQNDPRRNQM